MNDDADDGTDSGRERPAGTIQQTAGARTRRRFLALAGVTGTGAVAGCSFLGGDGETTTQSDDSDASGDGTGQGSDGSDGSGGTGGTGGELDLAEFRGSGALVEGRGDPGGTPIAELPDLDGELNFYLGGGEGGLYLQLIRAFRDHYPNFSFNYSLENSSSLANKIIEETRAGGSPADVFLAVDAGSLAAVAEAGATEPLPSSVTDPVPANFRTEDWVGIAGRARAIPYHTAEIDEADVPETVQDIPGNETFADAMGWAPTYSAFQSFVTAMRKLRGESATRDWLEGMQALGVTDFPDEFRVSNAVADGELAGGLANHYYALRVRNARPDAPIDLAFTSGDAGALVNVSGAEVVTGTDDADLARTFVRHLLSREAQEFFATRTFAYPTVADVRPPGGLPSIDELNPPDVSLSELSDVEGTIDLLRDTGAL
jgi:iron(III) transport system substrate-binding protein